MIKGIYDASRNLHTQMRNIEIVANNLANINTTGYKREIPFSEYMSRLENQPMNQLTDFNSGAFTETSNPFDLAIDGNAFFVVQTENGEELTKNGRFKLTEDGVLINENRQKVLSSKGEINILESMVDNTQPITIAKNGEIKIGEMVVDRILVAQIPEQELIERTQNQNFRITDGNYTTANEDEFSILQGYLEDSNTNPIIEMETMIRINKNFEAAQKIITALDSVMAQSKDIARV